MPVPFLVRLVPAPARTQLIACAILAGLLALIVETAARLMVPPESSMDPDDDAKFRSPALTVFTAMNPAPSPSDALPKFRTSAVVVVTLFPFTTVNPVISVVQPPMVAPRVGTLHVPVASPKPASPSLASQ